MRKERGSLPAVYEGQLGTKGPGRDGEADLTENHQQLFTHQDGALVPAGCRGGTQRGSESRDESGSFFSASGSFLAFSAEAPRGAMMPEAILVLSSSVFLYTLWGGRRGHGLGRLWQPGARCWTGCERDGEGTDMPKSSQAQNVSPADSREGTGRGNSTQWHQTLTLFKRAKVPPSPGDSLATAMTK